MFGFGKKKSEPQKPERGRRSGDNKERRSQNLAQLGFLGVGDDGDVDNMMGGYDIGDDDLEEELAMLLDDTAAPRRPTTSPAKKPHGSASAGAAGRKSGGVSRNIDINIDNVAMEEDEDDDIDVDDPELEAELGDILGVPSSSSAKGSSQMDFEDAESETTPAAVPTMNTEQLISLLQERLVLYEKAKQAADSAGDTAKSRRFTRGLKTLKEMIPKAKSGRVIDESEIPPVVSVGVIQKDKQPQADISSHEVPQVPPKVPPRPGKSIEPKFAAASEPEPAPPVHLAMDSDDINTRLPEPILPTRAFEPQPSPNQNIPTDMSEQPMHTVTALTDPLVESRLKDYKRAAVTLKRNGNVQEAIKYLKLSKTLELAIKNAETINLDDYPSIESSLPDSNDLQETAGSVQPAPTVVPDLPKETIPVPDSGAAAVGPSSEDLFGAPPPPQSVMEALEQRLDKYKSEVEKATAASNSSKARRMGRIVKQYEEAITLYKKGKPVPFDELPTPPGFAPIPTGPPPGPPLQTIQSPPSNAGSSQPQIPSTHVPASPGSPEKKPKESPTPATGGGTGQSPSGAASTVSRTGKPMTKLTLQEKQLHIITLRQKQFKEAALNAKQRGDLNQAREFLRTAKGFDKLIQVAQAGLPVDMATLPAPPEAVAKLELDDADNFEVVSASDCIMPSGDAAEVYSKLEDDLKKQLKMCMRTRDHFKSIGDVASANRFESMALESKRDLDALRLTMKTNGGIPKYHYENRIFSITECNTDVAEDEIDINIIQGLNYKVSNPSDVDTFVKIELPYPSAEEVQTNKTHVVKDTNNPQYNASYKMSINRTARNFQRFVHRHGVKCEIWSKGGFLRGSTLIGTATVKLLPLETKCTLHDAFDVMDGRKVVGKLEVKLRIREPVLTKQITQKKEKWLSIDRA